MGAQALRQRRNQPDRSFDEQTYFGAPIDNIDNADTFGLVPEPDTDLYRISYLYLMVFGNDSEAESIQSGGQQYQIDTDNSDYGGIQVRGQTYLHLREGAVPTRLQRVIQHAAHRGANLFDTGVQESIYSGYLTGFNAVENAGEYRNWEVEPVARREARGATPGKIEWTTEIYLEANEADPDEYAALSGVGSGIADPWSLREHHEAGEPPVSAQQEIWKLGEQGFNQAKNAYQVSPPGGTQARQRSRNLHRKTVYINGLPVGSLDKRGRTWLKKEYSDRFGLTYRGDHSRESLLENTVATHQALRVGGNLYKVDESPEAVYLVTARAKPDDFNPVDPEDIDPEREVQPGTPERTYKILAVQQPEESTRIECRQDQQIIRHLGYSTPIYDHEIQNMWAWPGFRPVEEYGNITTPEDDRDEGQAGLDEFDDGGQS
jgi:hypothetical protein